MTETADRDRWPDDQLDRCQLSTETNRAVSEKDEISSPPIDAVGFWGGSARDRARRPGVSNHGPMIGVARSAAEDRASVPPAVIPGTQFSGISVEFQSLSEVLCDPRWLNDVLYGFGCCLILISSAVA